jgi:hypothetical protein
LALGYLNRGDILHDGVKGGELAGEGDGYMTAAATDIDDGASGDGRPGEGGGKFCDLPVHYSV